MFVNCNFIVKIYSVVAKTCTISSRSWNRTAVDNDWRFDKLCGSHLQSQSELHHLVIDLIGQLTRNIIGRLSVKPWCYCNLGQKVLRILHFLTHRTPIPRIWYRYGPSSPHPGQNCLVGIRNDPAWLQHCFLGETGEYFCSCHAFKSFILKLDMVTSIFVNIFVQDCGYEDSKSPMIQDRQKVLHKTRPLRLVKP